MNDFKKLIKITWKRFYLRILLISLFTALFNGLYSRNSVENDFKSYTSSIKDMALDLNKDIDIKDYDNISLEMLKESENMADRYAKRFGIKRQSDIDKLSDEEASSYYNQVYDNDSGVNLSILQDYDKLQLMKNGENIFGLKYFKGLIMPILLFIVIISMMITSIEESLPYYEFTMMMPWRKCDELPMKSAMVFLASVIILFVSISVEILVLKSSQFGEVFTLNGFSDLLFKVLLLMFTTSIFVVSTGMIAGNFLGHIGLMIIAIGSLELVITNLEMFISIFDKDLRTYVDGNFYNFVSKSSNYLKPFISLTHVSIDSIESLLSFLLISLIIALTSYLVNKKVSSEKSGLMITSRPIEVLCKVMAVFTLTTLLYMIVTSMLYESHNVVINLTVYILSLLISYKLFDILFKIRIKF